MTETVDVPEDVRKAAEAVADEIDRSCLWGNEDDYGLHHYEASVLIAKAILAERAAERARCAKKAEAVADTNYALSAKHPEVPDYSSRAAGAIIAASAIRSQTP